MQKKNDSSILICRIAMFSEHLW